MLVRPRDYKLELDGFRYESDFVEARSRILKAVEILYTIKGMPGLSEIDPIIQILRDIAGKAILDHETRQKIQREHIQAGKANEPLDPAFDIHGNVITSSQEELKSKE